jgi:hypothetical protein
MLYFIVFFLAGCFGLYFYLQQGFKHYKPLKLVELEILQSEQVAAITKIKFRVVFRTQHVFGSKELYFNTIGFFETSKPINRQTLESIVTETQYGNYIELNMKNREIGEFLYDYPFEGSFLTVTYKAF